MTEPLRITFCLANGGIGGTELNAVRTAERLDRTRFDLDVVSLADYAPIRERYEAAGIPVRTLTLRSFKSLDYLRQGRSLARHLRDRRTQVFHAHDSYGNLLGVPWARAARVPGVLASRRWFRTRFQTGHGAGNRIAFRLAHRVLTNAPSVATHLASEEGVPRAKIRVVPNFLDEEAFDDATPGEAIRFRAELGIPADARLIGIVAQLRPEKDHLTLVEAATSIVDRHPDAHLVLIGEGETREAIEARRDALGLADRLHLAGLRRGPGNLHRFFDISVLCSRTEALSNSILEAMAAGRPVVATRVGGNPDAVVHDETGLLVAPGDARALGEALARLLADPAAARALGEAGRRRARTEYTLDAALGALEGVYREVSAANLRAGTTNHAVAA